MPRLCRLPLAVALWVCIAGLANSALIIDDFDTAQSAAVIPPFVNSPTSVAGGAGILGGERDFELSLLSGQGATLQSDFDGNSMLEHGQIGSSTATSLIVWDGADGDPLSLDPTGLGGVDFTVGGTLSGIRIVIDLNDLSAPLTLSAYTDGSNWSSATVILPGGIPPKANLFVPYLDFVPQAGSGADFTNIGAFSMFIDGSSTPSLDLQLELIAASTPVPEPTSVALLALGGLLIGGVGRFRRQAGR